MTSASRPTQRYPVEVGALSSPRKSTGGQTEKRSNPSNVEGSPAFKHHLSDRKAAKRGDKEEGRHCRKIKGKENQSEGNKSSVPLRKQTDNFDEEW